MSIVRQIVYATSKGKNSLKTERTVEWWRLICKASGRNTNGSLEVFKCANTQTVGSYQVQEWVSGATFTLSKVFTTSQTTSKRTFVFFGGSKCNSFLTKLDLTNNEARSPLLYKSHWILLNSEKHFTRKAIDQDKNIIALLFRKNKFLTGLG